MTAFARVCAALTLLACTAPLQAHAQTAAAPRPFAFSVGAATDYRSKGISKSDDEGYAFAAADWKSRGGLFYAGVAAATVDMAIGASYETDLKVGVRPKAAGWDLDFMAFYRAFPDSNAGADDDYVEFRAQAARNIGKWNVRLLTWQTPDNVGAAEASNWSEARLLYKVTPRIRASAALGRHSQDNGPDYAAWNAGVAFDVAPKVELDLRWYDTDGHQFGDRFDGEAVAALVAKF